VSEYLDYSGDDSENISSEFADDTESKQFKLLCFCETCGFTETLFYQEDEREVIKDIAESIHEQKFPNCNGKISF